jgi:hypothetical protein
MIAAYSADGQRRDTGTFIFLMACLLGGMLIAAYAFHLYLSVG